MAEIVTGGVIALDFAVNQANPAAINITTPNVTYDRVLVLLNCYEGAGNGVATFTLDGNNSTVTPVEDTTSGQGFSWLGEWSGGDLPAQNTLIAVDPQFDDTPNNGPCGWAIFLNNSQARDQVDMDAAAGGNVQSAITVATPATDLVLAMEAYYGTNAPATPAAGWTEVGTHLNRDNWSASLYEMITPVTNSAFDSEEDYYSNTVILSVPLAGGGGGSSIAPIRSYLNRRMAA